MFFPLSLLILLVRYIQCFFNYTQAYRINKEAAIIAKRACELVQIKSGEGMQLCLLSLVKHLRKQFFFDVPDAVVYLL